MTINFGSGSRGRQRWSGAAVVAVALSLCVTAAGPAQAVMDEPTAPPPSAAAIDVPNPEAVYQAVNPCRIADTRSAGGKLTGTARGFYVSGTTNFVPQGGKSGGCGIPASATSVSISITTVNPTGNGWLVAYPVGASVPTATSMNFSGDRKSTTSFTVKLGSGTAKRLNLRNFEANADVIIDVNGYFAEQMAGMVGFDGSLYQGTSRVVSSSKVSPGVYTVTFDRDVFNCLPIATPYSGKGVYASAYAFDGNTITILQWSIVGGVATAYDNYVYFGVIC